MDGLADRCEDDDGVVAVPPFWNLANLARTSARFAATNAAVYMASVS